MKYIDDYRDAHLIKKAAARIKQVMPDKELKVMEVCGSHTQSFCRFGLRSILPEKLKFISGPGCPVCVSHESFIDNALELAKAQDVIIATFGDMLRVPGSNSSLEKERARGANIQIIYSPLDSLKIAKRNFGKRVVFLGVGFETTAPVIALSILAAKKEGLTNLSYLCALKLMPTAMEYLLKDKAVDIDAFLCPGHVSSIIGTRPYEFIPKNYKIPCCVAGFEPLDILEGIYLLIKQINDLKPTVSNQYSRVVKKEGNIRARKIIAEVFDVSSANWRGLGEIKGSGLKIKGKFRNFDTEKVFSMRPGAGGRLPAGQAGRPATKCKCADVLKGLISPDECPLFKKTCTPEKPLGPCMVSIEGACNAYYKYR